MYENGRRKTSYTICVVLLITICVVCIIAVICTLTCIKQIIRRNVQYDGITDITMI